MVAHHLKSIEYQYLAFRRIVVFLDEWLSYLIMTVIYYHYGERNWYILTPCLMSLVVFNSVGYLYLGYIEQKLDIYGFNKIKSKPKRKSYIQPLVPIDNQPQIISE